MRYQYIRKEWKTLISMDSFTIKLLYCVCFDNVVQFGLLLYPSNQSNFISNIISCQVLLHLSVILRFLHIMTWLSIILTIVFISSSVSGLGCYNCITQNRFIINQLINYSLSRSVLSSLIHCSVSEVFRVAKIILSMETSLSRKV